MAKLKICGLTCEADVTAVNEVKPDFAGFVIEVPGRRRSVTPEQAKVLVKGLNEETLPIGVFVDAPPELPISLLREQRRSSRSTTSRSSRCSAPDRRP